MGTICLLMSLWLLLMNGNEGIKGRLQVPAGGWWGGFGGGWASPEVTYLGVRCCSLGCEVGEGHERNEQGQEVQENTSRRKHTQCVDYEATVAPKSTSLRSTVQMTLRNQRHHCPRALGPPAQHGPR